VKGAVASVLQVRDPQKNARTLMPTSFLYIIAGDGAVRFGGRTESVTAGCSSRFRAEPVTPSSVAAGTP